MTAPARGHSCPQQRATIPWFRHYVFVASTVPFAAIRSCIAADKNVRTPRQ